MSKKDEPAFPFIFDPAQNDLSRALLARGLTKRELFAAMILSGWAAKGIATRNELGPRAAVKLSEKLIKALEESGE